MPAFAHEAIVHRKALVTLRPNPSGTSVDLLVWLRLSGQRAVRLIAQADIDRDGVLTGIESIQMGGQLSPEALGGLFLMLNERALTPVKATAQAKIVDARHLEVMALIEYPATAASEGTITVSCRRIDNPRGLPAHEVEIGALPPLALGAPTGLKARVGPSTVRFSKPFSAAFSHSTKLNSSKVPVAPGRLPK